MKKTASDWRVLSAMIWFTKMKVYYIVILMLIASGCKKSPKMQPPPVLATSNGMLTRTITLDSNYSPTKYVYQEYRYDDSDRVQRYIKYEVDSSLVPAHTDTVQVITFSYNYNNATTLPDYALEDYRTSLYHLANAAHQYFYDSQGRLIVDTLIDFYHNNNVPVTTDRGVVIARHIHYNGTSVTVDNTNLDLVTLQQGTYRDSIGLDANNNVTFSHTLDGVNFVTGNRDDYQQAGYFISNYTYSTLQNPLHRLTVSNIMAFVQTGFPGGSFYAGYFSKNLNASSADMAPGISNPVITNFKYTTDAANTGRITKVVFSRSGASQHGGFETFFYDTHF